MKSKNFITINGDHFELNKADDRDLVCTTCDLREECDEIANKESGLCYLFDVSPDDLKQYHFVKKYIKQEKR